MKKKIFVSVCFLLVVWGTARFCHHKTKGFRIEKVRGNTSSLSSSTIQIARPDQRALLNQKFTYFGRGLQSFCFLGEDQTTVLKLFNNRYQKKIQFLQKIPPIGSLKEWKHKRIGYLKKKLQMTFESYDLANSLLENEAGILYFHPEEREASLGTLSVTDPLGITHTLDADKLGFVLQKKATLVYPYLASCMAENDEEKAKRAIEKLISLLALKMDRGIADRDPLIRTNFGFIGDEPMQIDIGPFSMDPAMNFKKKPELKKITLSLKHWLEENYPPLAPYVDEAIETY